MKLFSPLYRNLCRIGLAARTRFRELPETEFSGRVLNCPGVWRVNRPFVTAAVTLLISIYAYGQGSLVWRWSNPTPHGNNIIDMVQTNSFWIQVAEKGRIYTSGDSQNWTPWESGTTAALRSVAFFNGKLLMGGENGTILFGDSVSNLRLITLRTTDWIEGVTASPNLAVAVGDNGAIYTSSSGLEWQRQTVSFTNWLRSVTFGTPAGIGIFVAVGESGLIATSDAGRIWQRRPSPTTQDLNRVVWGQGQFWAVGNGGQVLTSATGLAWQLVNASASSNLNAIALSPNATLVAGEDEVRLREGLGAWSNELDPAKALPAPAWTYLSAAWGGQSFLLGGRTGMLVEGFKTNQTSSPTFWLPLNESPRNWLWDVKRFPEVYVAVGDSATIMTSVNGVEWTQEVPPETTFGEVFLGIGGRTNLAIAVGSAGTIVVSRDERRQVVTTNPNGSSATNEVSTLGIFWQPVQHNLTIADLQGVAVQGNLFVVTGSEGAILTSTDGTNWVKRNSGTTKFLSSVEPFPGGFVSVGDDGALLTSVNGLDWTVRNSQTTNWLYRARFLGGRLLVVGQNGTLMTSRDGVTWTRQATGTDRWLNDVHFINNSFYAVGNQGTVLTSADASTWREVGTITSKSLYAMASHEGKLVTVGMEGVILRSQIVPVTAPVRFVQFPRRSGENVFVFAGETDQRFSLDRSTNLIDWTVGPTLEILDPSGTLLFVDDRPNDPRQQFFRTR